MTRLSKSAAPAGEVRDVLWRLVAGVAHQIEALPDRAGDRIHEIRVGMKRFRATLALLSGVIPPETYERGDRLAREVKDHFASSRDSDVLRDLLLDLLEPGEAGALEGELGLLPVGPVARPADAAVRADCRRLAKLVEEIPSGSGCDEVLVDGWIRTYRAGRRTMELCRGEKDDFLFHEWRKLVKQLLYQSAALPGCRCLARLVPEAEKLASVLGKQHDLALLGGRFAEMCPGHRAERVVGKSKRSTGRRALEVAGKLYKRKPSALRKLMEKS